MVMQEQARRLSEPLRWGRREKTVIGAFGAIVALAAVALVVFALSSGAPARADCITLTFANTLGGSEAKACGQKASALCASGAYPRLADQMRAQCAKAGFPYRPPR
jgi:hypothetical protein